MFLGTRATNFSIYTTKMEGAGPQILGTGANFKRVPCLKSCRVNRALTFWCANGTVVPFLLTLEALCLLRRALTFGCDGFAPQFKQLSLLDFTRFWLWKPVYVAACFLGVYEFLFVVGRLWILVAYIQPGVLWHLDSERFLLPLPASILSLFQCTCNMPLWNVAQ